MGVVVCDEDTNTRLREGILQIAVIFGMIVDPEDGSAE